MQIVKNKTAAITIAILLTISMAASIMLVPIADAHYPAWQIPTYAYIVAEPDPIGVGQEVHVYLWLDCVFGAAGGTAATVGTSGSTSSAALLSNNYRFHNFKLTITDPNGTTTTQTFDVISDTTSSVFTKFTPDKVGTYTFNFSFPGQAYAQYEHYANSVLVNDTYLPSTASTTVTVQQEQIPAAINSYPLPEQYWTRPIYGENTDWWAISSNWLGTGSPVMSATGSGYITGFSQSMMQRYPGDAIGSQTAHIMWAKPLEFGGVVGGNYYSTQGVGFFEGSAYQQRFTNPIIINGYLYYNEPVAFSGPNSGPLDCVDLRTGELVWSRSDIPPLSFGYIYNLWDPDQHGVFPPILFTTNFARAFDARTGTQMFNVTNVPTGSPAQGPNNEQLRYVFANAGTASNPQWYLAQWNSSKLWQYDINPYTFGGSTSPSIINASNGALVSTIPIPITGTTGTLPTGGMAIVPYGSTLTVDANIPINSTTGRLATYDWNVSVPWINTMPVQPTFNAATGKLNPIVPGTNPVTVLAAFTDNVLLCRNGSLPVGFAASSSGYPQLPYTFFAVNLNASRGAIGSILWMKTYDPPSGTLTLGYGGADPTANVFVISYVETMQWVGYSMVTGEKLWGPTPSQTTWDYYGNPIYPYIVGQVAYGNLYASSFGGICYCYDLTNGNLRWTYGNGGEGNSTNAGLNVFYGVYPTFINAVGNGVVYLVTTEHTITDPIYKGALTRAINATDGTEIWTLSDYTGEFGAMSYAIADGYNVFYNGYDDQIYSVGRGPSATTVQAPMTAITAGDKVVIQGTVMDISAGTKQNQQAADFPNGVPAVSDASMKDWMGYVYQQKPFPTKVTGVEATLDAVDPNGNFVHIGTVTSDASGLFHYAWKTPNVPGEYTVIATFAGTNGYWASYAETAMYVQEAPAATPPPQYPTPVDYTLPIVGMGIVLLIAIAIVGILLLRKRS